MSLSLTVELAEMVCRFEHFGSGTFCDSWQWKLDTYRSASSDAGRYDIIFRNQEKEEEIPDPIRKVYEIQDGFFLRTVSVLPGGGTLWRCVRKLSGEALSSFNSSILFFKFSEYEITIGQLKSLFAFLSSFLECIMHG